MKNNDPLADFLKKQLENYRALPEHDLWTGIEERIPHSPPTPWSKYLIYVAGILGIFLAGWLSSRYFLSINKTAPEKITYELTIPKSPTNTPNNTALSDAATNNKVNVNEINLPLDKNTITESFVHSDKSNVEKIPSIKKKNKAAVLKNNQLNTNQFSSQKLNTHEKITFSKKSDKSNQIIHSNAASEKESNSLVIKNADNSNIASTIITSEAASVSSKRSESNQSDIIPTQKFSGSIPDNKGTASNKIVPLTSLLPISVASSTLKLTTDKLSLPVLSTVAVPIRLPNLKYTGWCASINISPGFWNVNNQSQQYNERNIQVNEQTSGFIMPVGICIGRSISRNWKLETGARYLHLNKTTDLTINRVFKDRKRGHGQPPEDEYDFDVPYYGMNGQSSLSIRLADQQPDQRLHDDDTVKFQIQNIEKLKIIQVPLTLQFEHQFLRVGFYAGIGINASFYLKDSINTNFNAHNTDRFKPKHQVKDEYPEEVNNTKKMVLGGQLKAGVSLPISPRISVQTGLEVSSLNLFSDKTLPLTTIFGLHAGIQYNF